MGLALPVWSGRFFSVSVGWGIQTIWVSMLPIVAVGEGDVAKWCCRVNRELGIESLIFRFDCYLKENGGVNCPCSHVSS